MYESFLVWENADHDGLTEGICNFFRKIDVVLDDEIKVAVIHDTEPGEQLQN